MEKLGSPSARAARIKRYIDGARDDQGRLKINWAHLLLAAMVENNYVRRILTTNFDPLIVEALALTGQPIRTYDLSTSGNYVQDILDSASVIYLHGQMHSMLLANSADEMAKVRTLYPAVLQEAVRGAMLVVVGYSGECDPVLDALTALPNIPGGVWWSHFSRSGGQPGGGVDGLFARHGANCHLATGDDADTFMRKLVLDGMQLDFPDEVMKPIKAIRSSLERVTSFPNHDIPDPDPVRAALDMLRRAEEMTDPPATVVSASDGQVLTRPPESLEVMSMLAAIDMAALKGDWTEFDRLRISAQPDPQSRLSQVVGDALLRRAGRDLEEGAVEAALSHIEHARTYGISSTRTQWLPVVWGNALSDQAKIKGDTPEADALFVEAGRKYAEAVSIKPDMHEAFYNWGTSLSEQARLKGNTPEAVALFVEAGRKYAEALRIKPDDQNAFNNLGNVLLAQARLMGDTKEADALLVEAGRKYAEALRIKPEMHTTAYNWGNALLYRAQLKANAPEADALFVEAGRKYAEALRIKPDNHEAFKNWGGALSEQARLKGNTPEADALFVEAGCKYAEALRIKPDDHEAFSNWGNVLSEQARLKGNTPEAVALFVEAGRKYAEALRIKPDSHEAYNNWANALSYQAQAKGNTPEADALFVEAGRKYAEALRIKPDKHGAFNNWGNALSEQAKVKGDTPEADALFVEAGRKYAEAVQIKPDLHEAFNNWGTALSDQARLKGNTPEAIALFVEAGRKYAEALRIEPDDHEALNNSGNALLGQARLMGDNPEADALFVEAGRRYAEALRIKPDLHEAQYNLGCLYALRGLAADSVGALHTWARNNSHANRRSLDEDRDFDRVRSHVEFKRFRDSLPE
jgi:tetratricopeptide (TPR) repeat protein